MVVLLKIGGAGGRLRCLYGHYRGWQDFSTQRRDGLWRQLGALESQVACSHRYSRVVIEKREARTLDASMLEIAYRFKICDAALPHNLLLRPASTRARALDGLLISTWLLWEV